MRRRASIEDTNGHTEPVEDTAQSDGKTTQYNLRIRNGQLAFWKDAAEAEGVSLTAWIKRVCTQAALEVFAGIDERYGKRKGRGVVPFEE